MTDRMLAEPLPAAGPRLEDPPAPPPRRPSRGAVLRVALVVVVVASLTFVVVGQATRLPEIDWRLEPGWLVLAMAGLLGFEWTHIELWRRMLHSLGGDLPRWKGRSIWATTLLARYVPGSVLMAVGRVALAEREGVPRRVSSASVVYEVALTVTAALLISTYLVLRLPVFAPFEARWLVLAVPVAGVLALHPRIFHPLADFGLRRIGAEPLPITLSFGRVLAYLVLFALSFVVAGLGVLGMTLALHPVAAGDVGTVIASYSLAFATGVLGFLLPGALGAREAGLVVAVSAAVPAAVALAVAVVLRLVQIGVELGYAGVLSLVARRRPGE